MGAVVRRIQEGGMWRAEGAPFTRMSRKITRFLPPQPPTRDQLPLVNASPEVAQWLEHYWRKLNLPVEQTRNLAVTDNRAEFARWTGRRLNPMALGCYCFLPLYPDDAPQAETIASATLTAPANQPTRLQPVLPGFTEEREETCGISEVAPLCSGPAPRLEDAVQDFRHLIFIEPDLLVEGVEITVAHELIHLSDRVSGTPRKHHCHGHDSISVDEAALTERDPEWLRELLAEETRRREATLRKARPYRYVYVCPNCGKEYPRVRKYSRAVSCGHCDQRFNAAFLLQLRPLTDAPDPNDGDEKCSKQA
jgi:DNA-directed RNA polymerase subunit RPC12/RpoP